MVDPAQREKRLRFVSEAKTLLACKDIAPEPALALADELINVSEFGLARRLLERVLPAAYAKSDLERGIAQKCAFAIYQDPDLNREMAVTQAIAVLEKTFDLGATADQETLGLAGAIYKRRWEISGRKIYLEQALSYYERGIKPGIAGDDGYTAINAAYIHDVLAFTDEKASQKLNIAIGNAPKHRQEAQQLRKQVIAALTPKIETLAESDLGRNYWLIASLMEAQFGLGNYAEVEKWLDKIKNTGDIPEWQIVSTARQLVSLTQYQAKPDTSPTEWETTEAWRTLLKFVGQKAYALRSLLRGKLGLALSGGGFRASLYHIGVLAKLAEYDLLRHVEVLSCVSGGSILGAYYYLELRKLINADKKADNDIGRGDFIRIIDNMVDTFLDGVQENPRVRLIANPWTNLRLLFSLNYSRTQRLGELYEELLYSRIRDGEGDKPRWLNNLYMYPDGDTDFLPRRDNWSKQCKVPVLVLNATTLNTGHNWQFTAAWMGESPFEIDADFDSNDRYPRLYYADAPAAYQQMRLGTAVGASSCVPGLFEPIIMTGLYRDTTVRLVDGGIFDNQGIESLIEQDCNLMIVSDASGQLTTVQDPGGGIVKPLLRANNTVMERVRINQFEDLKNRAYSGVLKGFAFVHLNLDLQGKVAQVDAPDQAAEVVAEPDAHTSYGVRKDVQHLLAAVRTDLDSFSDLEGFALMTSGYRAMERQLQQERSRKLLALGAAEAHDWKFLKVQEAMLQQTDADPALQRLLTNLRVSGKRLGKVWRLSRPLNIAAKLTAGAFIAALIVIGFTHPGWKPLAGIAGFIGNRLTISVILIGLAMLLTANLITALVGTRERGLVTLLVDYKDLPRRFVVGLGVGLIGWLGAFIHLRIFDRLFKSIGRVR